MTTKTLRIPLIIDANGKWAAHGSTYFDKGEEPDWAFMDDTADYRDDLVCPQRLWITVEVELPEVKEVTGAVEPA